MKKTLALILTCVLVLSCCGAIFVSAAVEVGPNTFVVTHYNTTDPEGAAAIMTDAYTGGGWWLHIAFEPTQYPNTYKVVGISNGLGDGEATPLTVPEGGFVYGLNYGNNWPALAADPANADNAYIQGNKNEPNYTNKNVSDMIAAAEQWAYGDVIVISGVDIEKKEIPTTTPDKKWYEDGYTCTASYTKFDPNNPPSADNEPDITDDEYAQEIIALFGEHNKDADFVLDLKSSTETDETGKGFMTVVLTVKDIKEGVNLQALSATLNYDANRLMLITPKTEEVEEGDDGGSLDCVTAWPYGENTAWENMTVEGSEAGTIEVNLANASAPSKILDADHTFELTFKFQFKGLYTKAGAYIKADSVTGMYAPDDENGSDVTIYYGDGSYTITAFDPPKKPDDPVPSGDAGILTFAVLGIFAVAGCATAIKAGR